MFHSLTSSRKLVDQLIHAKNYGSYTRVKNVENNTARTLCASNLRPIVYCVLVKRHHFDYNPTSTTTQSAFHGTAIIIANTL